jgi:hypothetical protein
MNEIPVKLRHLVIDCTHGTLINKISFFNKKSREFNSTIVYELKHMNMGDGELLY